MNNTFNAIKIMKWLCFLCFLLIFFSCDSIRYRTKPIDPPDAATEQKIKHLYKEAKLAKKISFELFRMGMIGLYGIENSKQPDKLVLVDFTKPSTQKRFYVIDLKAKALLYECLVAHGRKSGGNMATKFSNIPESKQSSLGFFLTAETYQGKHGRSLRLDGIEKGINDQARGRSIVIHGASYVSQDFIKKHGRLGRSWGCPALPMELSEGIIQTIANGSCLFIYGKDDAYFSKSNYMVR